MRAKATVLRITTFLPHGWTTNVILDEDKVSMLLALDTENVFIILCHAEKGMRSCSGWNCEIVADGNDRLAWLEQVEICNMSGTRCTRSTGMHATDL